MSSEVINRHIHRISEDSNGAGDVEMLLASEKSPGPVSVASVDTDTGSNYERGASVHHHHYHYYYHHHFHHQQPQPLSPTLPSASQSASPVYQPSSSSPTHVPPKGAEADTEMSSSSSPPSPSISLSSSSSSPTSPSATTSISSRNTAALVRTISNGSTFGPIINLSLKPCLSKSTQVPIGSSGTIDNSSYNRSSQPKQQSISSPGVATPTDSPNLSNSPLGTGSSASPSVPTTTASSSSNSPSSLTGSSTTVFSPVHSSLPAIELPLIFGENFILTSQIEASNLYRCLDTETMEEYCCKVVLSKNYYDFLSGHLRMDGYDGINQVRKIIVGRVHTFILFAPSYGDLHSYVRNKRRLRESEAMPLFQQIVQIVADCHSNGIILRDLKLRKFIFSNKERTQLKLETLEGASLFDDDDDDTLSDKHGCPAYVSPEILYSNSYSGMAADCWSLGVILYTMLMGRYPFHDTNPSVVFFKIRRGTYYIPETLSKHAKCLIRSLIRIDPADRLSAEDALAHRWFQVARSPVTSSIMVKQRSLPNLPQQHHHHHHHFHQSTSSQHNSSSSDHSPHHQSHHHSINNGASGHSSPLTSIASSALSGFVPSSTGATITSSLGLPSPCCMSTSTNSLDQIVPDLILD